LLLELIRMKKSYKKADWYKGRCDEIFKLMKWENHKDHVGFDFSKEGIYIDDISKYQDNCKMSVMDEMENIGGIITKADLNEQQKQEVKDLVRFRNMSEEAAIRSVKRKYGLSDAKQAKGSWQNTLRRKR